MAKKTLEERIVATEKLLAKYKQEQVTAAILNNIEARDDVSFNYGRGDTRREIAGAVVSVGDTPQGKLAVVQFGEGLDIKVVKVRVADITANRTADARTTAKLLDADEAPAEGDPLNAA
jgi:hypothetical protein